MAIFHGYVKLPEGIRKETLPDSTNFITTKPCSPEAWKIMVYVREIISIAGRKIQVSDIL